MAPGFCSAGGTWGENVQFEAGGGLWSSVQAREKLKNFQLKILMASEVYAKISQSKKKRGSGIEA